MDRLSMGLVIGIAAVAAVYAVLMAAEGKPGDAPRAPASQPTSQPATSPASQPASQPATALSFVVKDIAGKDVNLAEKYAGKVVLIVNVASRCGFTPQYAGLQELYEKYGRDGLAILGFPCNQFRQQEPGTNQEIVQFCQSKYHVTFDLFDKIDVNGQTATPLYKYLTGEEVPFTDKGPIKWNFEKFLVGRDGRVVARFRSKVTPDQIAKDIEAALAPK